MVKIVEVIYGYTGSLHNATFGSGKKSCYAIFVLVVDSGNTT